MYSVDSRSGYASYANGFSGDRNNQLSITSFEDKYIQKKKFIQEALHNSKGEGVALANATNDVVDNALKKGSIDSKIDGFSYHQTNSNNALLEPIQTQENKEAIKNIFEKSFIATNDSKPQNISEEILKAYNPLETKGEDIPQNAVSFVDEVSGKTIYVPLNEANAKRLNEKFGSLEKANSYVKGWYYDAAYKVGYLSGDSDGNGSISMDEGIHLKSLVSVINSKYYSIAESIPAGEEEQKRFLEQIGFIDNLADFINHSITQDINLDGDLSLKEVMSGDNEMVLFVAKNLHTSEITDIFVIKHFNFSSAGFSFDDFLLNLIGNNQGSINVDEKKDISLETIKVDEIDKWIRGAKKSKDKKHLSFLSSAEQTKLLKADAILVNLLKSS